MTKSHGSVRMGPISLFTLVITLCLAVLAVLAVTTAQATYAATERQAAFTSDTYANETAAQTFVAGVDAQLAGVREQGGGRTEALAALEGALDSVAADAADGRVTVDASMGEGANAGADTGAGDVSATFTTESGCSLNVVLEVLADATYQILQWKTTTLWDDEGTGETLWSGPATTD